MSTASVVVPLARAFDISQHGGKAVGLARLMRAGMPVPDGFVVAHAALERCLTAAASMPLELADPIVTAARHIARGAPLAVRSSAAGEDGSVSSFAGQLESVLGVDALNGLEQAVKRVWASRSSDRVDAYTRARNAPLAGMGVIVQRQVDARWAGVLFTVSPERGAAREMLCEYTEGLGDRLVAGEITPGRIAIARIDHALSWKTDDGASRPPESAIAELARAACEAEALFGCPQDIEWAIDREGAVWLLQSRPITTLSLATGRSILWSNANVNENFPQPICPLLYSVASAGYTRYFRGLGEAFGVSEARLQRMDRDLQTIIGVHAGRMYYNLTSIHAVLRDLPCGGVLSRWFDQFVGATGPDAAHAGPRRNRLVEALEVARIAFRTTRQYLRLEKRLRAFERAVDEYAASTAQAALERKTMLELRDDLRGFLDIRLRRWTGAGLSDAAAMACYGALRAVVSDGADSQSHHALLKGLDDLASAAPVSALWDLSRRIRDDARLAALFGAAEAHEVVAALAREPRYAAFKAALDDYLERYGFRFSGELMLTEPSFQERPEALVAILARYAAHDGESPHARLAEQRRDRIEETKRILRQLAKRRLMRALPWPTRATIAPPLVRAAQASIACRERARLKQALLYSRLRRVALEIGARLAREGRLDARDDVFFVLASELDELLSGTAMFPDSVRDLVTVRKRAHAAFGAMQPPDVMTAPEGEYPSCGAAPSEVPDGEGDVLRGTSVCGGVATGRVRVLSDVAEACSLEAGDILVTRQTDPGWAPAFVAIRGLVLERGGMLSHGAILAREYGIPTVVGVSAAASRIPDGSTVRIDGDRGVVQIIR
jgi:rifampicin phosphotransferase